MKEIFLIINYYLPYWVLIIGGYFIFAFWLYKFYFSRHSKIKKIYLFFPKKIYYFFFLLICLNLILVRLPFFNTPFGIQFNADKYTTYVPVALNMAQKNPFVFQNKSYVNILEKDNEQKFNCFWRLPLFDWGLAALFKANKFFSLEVLTRIYLTSLGLIFLLLFFLFTKKIFGTPLAVLSVFLFVFTPLFHLLTWLTTLDLFALIFLFLSLYLFAGSNKNLAYLFLGFTIITKLSFLIIAPPIFLILIFKEKRPFAEILNLILFASLPLLGWRIFIYPLPIYPRTLILKYLFLFLFIAFIVAGYCFLNKISLKKLSYFKIKILTFSVLAIFLVLFFLIYQDDINKLPSLFLTDKNLLLNADFYKVLGRRFKQINLDLFYYSFPFTVLLLPFYNRKLRFYLLSFLVSSILFFVISSKSIRFALYYNHIFIITNILFLVACLHLFFYSPKIKNKIKVLAAVSLLITVFLTAPNKIISVYKQNFYLHYIKQTAKFIKKNTQPNDRVLAFSSKYKTSFLYSQRPVILIGEIINNKKTLQTIRREVMSGGFFQAMKKHNIKFLLVNKDDKDFAQLLYFFTSDFEPMSLRTKQILEKLGYNFEQKKKKEYYLIYRPDKYFSLTKTFGPTQIYELKP